LGISLTDAFLSTIESNAHSLVEIDLCDACGTTVWLNLDTGFVVHHCVYGDDDTFELAGLLDEDAIMEMLDEDALEAFYPSDDEMPLPKLNPNASCTKCHSASIGMRHCDVAHKSQGVRAADHMHRECKRCGYSWMESCADSEHALQEEVAQLPLMSETEDDELRRILGDAPDLPDPYKDGMDTETFYRWARNYRRWHDTAVEAAADAGE
jgi:hypothetical protein